LIEVDKQGQAVWKYGGEEAPADQKLRFPTGHWRKPHGDTWAPDLPERF
jgi:hypothetical protein